MTHAIDTTRPMVLTLDGTEFFACNIIECEDYVNVTRSSRNFVSFWNFTYPEFNLLMTGAEIEVKACMILDDMNEFTIKAQMKNVSNNYRLRK